MCMINLTPHAINLTGTEIPPSGKVARIGSTCIQVGAINGVPLYETVWGNIENLPEPVPGTIYIVSSIVVARRGDRSDVFAPATSHPDVVRNEKGQIVSVPGLTN